jgi:hypothetical protein
MSCLPSFPFAAPFACVQRLGAPVRNGLKLMCVGVGASFVSVAVTNTLIALRQALDPTFAPLNQAQNVLATSAAYGLYMATSSNIRYAEGEGNSRWQWQWQWQNMIMSVQEFYHKTDQHTYTPCGCCRVCVCCTAGTRCLLV